MKGNLKGEGEVLVGWEIRGTKLKVGKKKVQVTHSSRKE